MERLNTALIEALNDEYKARATYRAILDKFGNIRPFVNIIESEERHIQALLLLFRKYGLPIPQDPWDGCVAIPASVQEACQQGVQAEIENAALYHRLLDLSQGYPDVQTVFLNLQRASQNNHLPAFQRCAARETPGDFQRRGRRSRGGQRRGRCYRDSPSLLDAR
ncbi:ferritin-like domain-containing protein [Alkalinema pantanalense CENA528]|uniref:ferritin-like domain-containing protein n=1 Tax=Alkalinema pantanalense TaxID=1620705 RepID=UPI003D6F5D36